MKRRSPIFKIFTAGTLTVLFAHLAPWGLSQENPQRGGESVASDKSPQAVQRRQLPKPADPEAAALLIHLLQRFAANIPDKTEMDIKVEQRLSGKPGSREAARRLAKTYESIPLAEREAALGRWARLSLNENIPAAVYRQVWASAARSLGKAPVPIRGLDDHPTRPKPPDPGGKHVNANRIDKGSLPQKPFPNRMRAQRTLLTPASYFLYQGGQDSRFVLWYEGLWTHSETDEDHLTPSDEIYIITSVVGASGRVETVRHPRPHDPRWYEDLDDGDRKVGPRRRCWGTEEGRRAEELTLTVSVFEQDSGDAAEVEQAIELLWDIAGVICAASEEVGPVPCIIAAGIAGIVNAVAAIVTGGEDDLVEVKTRTITAGQMRDWGNSSPGSRHDIPFHFSTVHNGSGNAEGADYHVYFSIRPPD